MKYFSGRYRRHKRIKRILSLNDGYDAYRPKHRANEGILFPRYTWIRFLLTLFIIIIFAVPLSKAFDSLFSIFGFKIKVLVLTPFMMVFGFIVVEVIDEFFLNWEKTFDHVRNILLPIVGVFFIAFVFIISKNPGNINGIFSDWRNSINDRLQVKPTQVTITPERGSNWYFLNEKSRYLKNVGLSEAKTICHNLGPGWGVYDGDEHFIPNPNPIFDHSFYIWMNSHGAQFEIDGIKPPKVYMKGNENSKLPVLCIQKKEWK